MVASLFLDRARTAALVPTDQDGHISLVVASGMLFAWRGAMVLAGAHPGSWVRHWRMFSCVIDTGLLAAGATLWATLSPESIDAALAGGQALALLVTWCSARWPQAARGRPSSGRPAVAALAVYGFMASVAYMHDPLGLLLPWYPMAAET